MATLVRHWRRALNVTSWLLRRMFAAFSSMLAFVKQECELRNELRRPDELLIGNNWKGHNGKEEVKPERLDTGLDGHSTCLGRGARTCPRALLPVPSSRCCLSQTRIKSRGRHCLSPARKRVSRGEFASEFQRELRANDVQQKCFSRHE